jgi:hypothetical protein
MRRHPSHVWTLNAEHWWYLVGAKGDPHNAREDGFYAWDISPTSGRLGADCVTMQDWEGRGDRSWTAMHGKVVVLRLGMQADATRVLVRFAVHHRCVSHVCCRI